LCAKLAVLASDGHGRWTRSLPLPPGRHEYLFVIDGDWVPDPRASETAVNPFGGINSVVRVKTAA
jgi:hypothetical protein